jgi:hypothetical protein
MAEEPDGEFSLTPPDANRVAARALVLAAVSCRAQIEKDAHDPGAEKLRQDVVRWLDAIGATEELEPAEVALLSTPLGKLDRRTQLNATWRSEGMAVLAWALQYVELPPVHIECDPSDTANAMGFLDARQNTPLHKPSLRDYGEIESWADAYLTFHWRLRQRDRDLAIAGVGIDKVEHATFRRILSITQERHQAFNWLVGLEGVYSEVMTDT